MKTHYNLFVLSFFCFAITFSSCTKQSKSLKKSDDIVACKLSESLVSSDASYQDFYNWQSPDVERYILKDILVDPTCNCIVSGYVKYVKNGKTVALVKYGDGTCDSWAIKINCIDGSCAKKAGAYCTKFEQTCETSAIVN